MSVMYHCFISPVLKMASCLYLIIKMNVYFLFPIKKFYHLTAAWGKLSRFEWS